MFIEITKFTAILSTAVAALALTACGGGVQEGAPHELALSSPPPVQMAAATPAATQTVNSSDAAARTLLWEQSISLEMNRQHEEQLERARNEAAQPETM